MPPFKRECDETRCKLSHVTSITCLFLSQVRRCKRSRHKAYKRSRHKHTKAVGISVQKKLHNYTKDIISSHSVIPPADANKNRDTHINVGQNWDHYNANINIIKLTQHYLLQSSLHLFQLIFHFLHGLFERNDSLRHLFLRLTTSCSSRQRFSLGVC